MVEDVNRKTGYFDLVANKIAGSELKYSKKVAEEIGRQAVKGADFRKKMKNYLPLPDVTLLDEKILNQIETNLSEVNKSEIEAIKTVRNNYGLILKKW